MSLRRRTSARKRRRNAAVPAPRLPSIDWRKWTPAAALLLGLAAAAWGVRFAMDQPVEQLEFPARLQRVQKVDVQKAVHDVLGGQGIVAVDLQALSSAVQQIPWVDRASVARRWPRTLQVSVVEQVPVARWGESGLLNARGEIFIRDARHIPAELPELAGPPGSEAQMTERYLAAQPRLAEVGLRLLRLQLDERGSWDLELDNGVRLRLGSTLVDQRFDRFIAAAARIVTARAGEIRYVDMRYANGFAIGWRTTADEVKRG